MSREIEEWRPVVGYEGLYEVSDWSRVRSLDWVHYQKSKFGGIRLVKHKGKILKQNLSFRDGYYIVRLSKNSVTEKKYIHKLVAEVWIPNPENKSEIDHINTIKTDNRICNLRWCTHQENLQNPITKELQKSKMEGISNIHLCKPFDKISPVDGEVIKTYLSLSFLKNDGYSKDSVWKFLNGLYKKPLYAGFLWKRHK